MKAIKVCLADTSCMEGGCVKVSECGTHNVGYEYVYSVSSIPTCSCLHCGIRITYSDTSCCLGSVGSEAVCGGRWCVEGGCVWREVACGVRWCVE